MTQTQRNMLYNNANGDGYGDSDGGGGGGGGVEAKRPWPEVEFLFGEDENYQEIVSEIMQNVTTSITKVSKYIEVKEKVIVKP